MDIKIEKMIELRNLEWGKINKIKQNGNSLVFQRQIKNVLGETKWIDMFNISKNNLDELEFFGLKVILKEKPKLTRKERDFLEIHDIETYIARDESGLLVIGNTEPIQENDYWEWEENKLYLGESTFNFITWESGKAWSKSELMELEVIDD